MIFAGAASKPPTEKAAWAFQDTTGIKTDVVFGGSGYVLSQMILGKRGDLYFPGSSDYMDLAKKKGVVLPETEKIVVYLVPAINVFTGNPKTIGDLSDLTRPGLRVVIANPESVCVGAYAVEIVEKAFSSKQKSAFKKNLVNYTRSCASTAYAVALKAADAVIGWRVFQFWDPERIQTIPLKPTEIVRIGYIPIAVSRYTQNRPLAQRFIDFLLSDAGKAIFKKYHYFMTEQEASAWVGADKPVGGRYTVPRQWIEK
jgi:molybdate transport system substrate-binding protein